MWFGNKAVSEELKLNILRGDARPVPSSPPPLTPITKTATDKEALETSKNILKKEHKHDQPHILVKV